MSMLNTVSFIHSMHEKVLVIMEKFVIQGIVVLLTIELFQFLYVHILFLSWFQWHLFNCIGGCVLHPDLLLILDME